MQLSMLRTSVSSLGKTSTVSITTSLRRSTTTTNDRMGINRWKKDFETSKFCTNNPLWALLKTQECRAVNDTSTNHVWLQCKQEGLYCNARRIDIHRSETVSQRPKPNSDSQIS